MQGNNKVTNNLYTLPAVRLELTHPCER